MSAALPACQRARSAVVIVLQVARMVLLAVLPVPPETPLPISMFFVGTALGTALSFLVFNALAGLILLLVAMEYHTRRQPFQGTAFSANRQQDGARLYIPPWYFCWWMLLTLPSQRLLHWKGLVPRGGVQMLEPGIIFFVGLLGLAYLFVWRAAKIEALEQHGVRVVATVTSIEAHTMFTRVTAYWRHPQTRQVYPCHSWMLSNSLSFQPGSQVQVLVDPANYQHYSMKVAR